MNKAELIRAAYERLEHRVPMTQIERVVDEILSVVSEALKAGEEVQLADLGTFSVRATSVKTIAEFLPNKKKNRIRG